MNQIKESEMENEVTDKITNIQQEKSEDDQEKTQPVSAAIEATLLHYNEIVEFNNKTLNLLRSWENYKTLCGAAKKNYDVAVSELEDLIADGPDRQMTLPLDDDDGNNTDNETCETDWRNTPIDTSLDLTPSQFVKLKNDGIETIGELEDLRGGKGLRSIMGFGNAAVDHIENEIVNWLANLDDGKDEGSNDDESKSEMDDI